MSLCPIDEALLDENLLGAALGDPASWSVWLTALKAAFGHLLTGDELAVFARIAGDRPPPRQRVKELWCVVGRRGGKSRIAAALGVYLSLFESYTLAPGETGVVAIVAASRDQSAVILNYIKGYLWSSPHLAGEIEAMSADEITLINGIVIGVYAGSFRTVRGRTLVACIFDEVSFWRDESSASPDIETYRAVLPALATTQGMLIGISTPYRRVGLLHQKHRDFFGVNDPSVLVVAGSSQQFNPTLDATVIDRACASDPEAARAEWNAEFRSDLAAFLDDALIEAAVDYGRPLELPPRRGIKYKCFTDASGGRGGAYTLAIGHKEGECCVVDVLLGRHPPFDPVHATQAFAARAKEYGCTEVIGDNYAAAWVETAWRDAGLRYRRSEVPKSQIYLETLPLWTRGLVSIPDHKHLIRELRLLERRTSRQGKDTVDHGRGGSDDYANAVAGMLVQFSAKSGYDSSLRWVSGGISEEESNRQWRSLQYWRQFPQLW